MAASRKCSAIVLIDKRENDESAIKREDEADNDKMAELAARQLLREEYRAAAFSVRFGVDIRGTCGTVGWHGRADDSIVNGRAVR
mmetsp:Transcript_12937/g.28119  ORF Transcript_12937/g.28119 Transcript_12937/m.28119 type:complete len:85 (-) Transcript_12937:163-417(-)